MKSKMDKKFSDLQELIEKSNTQEKVTRGNHYASVLKNSDDEEGGSNTPFPKFRLDNQVYNFREIIAAAKNEKLAEEKEKSFRENHIIFMV